MRSKKLVSFLAAAGIGLAMAAAPAQSAIQSWSFQDDDIDFVVRNVGGTLTLINPTTCSGSGANSCTLTAGDILVSVFEFPTFTIDGVNAIPAGEELTGVAAVQFNGTTTDPLGNPVRTYSAPDVGLNAILALGGAGAPTVIGGGAGGFAMAAMWLNGTSGTGGDINLVLDKSAVPAPNFQPNCTDLANCIHEGSLGSLLQVDGGILSSGTKMDPDNFWFSGVGGSDISAVLGTNVNTVILNVNAGLSVLFNTVLPIDPQKIATGAVDPTCVINTADACVDFTLGATINGGNNQGHPLGNGSFAYSTTIIGQKYVGTVPEPGSLSLLGVALLCACAFARRKFGS